MALEDYNDRKDKLFGPGFLEKASKKLETDKALAKVTAPPLNPKKRAHSDEQPDLRSFCPKAPPANTAAGDFSARQSHTTNASTPTINSNKTTSLPIITTPANHPGKPDSNSPSGETTILLASLEPDHLRSLEMMVLYEAIFRGFKLVTGRSDPSFF